MTVGQRIRKLRREKDWTQAELGEQAGVNFRNIPRYESDKLRAGPKILTRFAKAFGVSVEELMGPVGATNSSLQDQELFRLVAEVDQMNDDDRAAVKRILHAMVIKNRVQNLDRIA